GARVDPHVGIEPDLLRVEVHQPAVLQVDVEADLKRGTPRVPVDADGKLRRADFGVELPVEREDPGNTCTDIGIKGAVGHEVPLEGKDRRQEVDASQVAISQHATIARDLDIMTCPHGENEFGRNVVGEVVRDIE